MTAGPVKVPRNATSSERTTMTATDPYRLTIGTETPDERGPGVQRADIVRTVLWLVLVISTVGNMVASYGAASTQLHLACGVVTALCVTALVTRHLRGRR
ncbi:hypothetical protein [Streptomyces liliifuscus]|uniref:Uncharacterized protein n=1 Tax=Streptomyces liliifuscus TaxID=2797636 RepID=A0A7T7L6F5_9ACTN|nr:hypothetical protein [Streptomyces liliifuscus]QQM47334.1 hypothetical protein JEQ17_20430 [Streptomyces liliifuscus]